MQVERLHAPHTLPLLALLDADPESNLFLIDVLRTRGAGVWRLESWYGALQGETIVAVALVIGRAAAGQPARLLVPAGEPRGCAAIGRFLRDAGPVEMLIGPRAPCDALWSSLDAPAPRLRYSQRLYVCDTPPAGAGLQLRQARLEEAEQVAALAAQMMIEDLHIDPRLPSPQRHLASVRARIDKGSTLVAAQDGSIVFQLNIGTRCPLGVQVGGTFVPPAHRGRGLSTRGMVTACRLLLAQSAMVTLHVNEANTPAVRCYERAGFRRAAPFRLLIR